MQKLQESDFEWNERKRLEELEEQERQRRSDAFLTTETEKFVREYESQQKQLKRQRERDILVERLNKVLDVLLSEPEKPIIDQEYPKEGQINSNEQIQDVSFQQSQIISKLQELLDNLNIFANKSLKKQAEHNERVQQTCDRIDQELKL